VFLSAAILVSALSPEIFAQNSTNAGAVCVISNSVVKASVSVKT